MSIPQWALVSAVKGILNDAENDGKVQALAFEIERIISSFFPGDSTQIKQLLVKKVLNPLSELLLKENVK